MKRTTGFLLATIATTALAYDPIADTRKIMAGTVTTTKVKNEYLSGARDGTTTFKGALAAYKAVRVAEAPAAVSSPAPIGPVGEAAFSNAPGLPGVASEFDPAKGIVTGIPLAEIANDTVGAFRFICGGDGQLLNDDPIVYPGQPGKSHLHQFFGNLDANASSTFQSLRLGGKSNCNWTDFTINRSAYWMPAMLDGIGNAVRPDFVSIYYKRRPIADPACKDLEGQHDGICVPLPNGLSFIMGLDPTNVEATKTGAGYYDCQGPTAKPGHYATLPEAAANCPYDPTPGAVQNQLGAVISAPPCWDGKNLDSPNHRSHMAYTWLDPNFGKWKCPASHPYSIPDFTMGVWYSVDANVANWRLSSDAMTPDKPHGYSFHADWKGAWDEQGMKTWMDNCINRKLSCASGNLGNGSMLIGAAQPRYGWRQPADKRLVPLASIPTSDTAGMPMSSMVH